MKDEDKTRKQLLSELAQLRQRIAELRALESERERAEERIQHLNLVLRAIRNINQLFTTETDRDRLIEGICNSLVETRGYHNAWMAVFDESGGLSAAAEAGLGADFSPMLERLKHGNLPFVPVMH